MGIADWVQPPGQEQAETLRAISVLLLRLLKHEERSFMVRDLGLLMLREILIEQRACRDVVYDETIRRPWLTKGKTHETMQNYYDMQTREATKHVEALLPELQEESGGSNMQVCRSDQSDRLVATITPTSESVTFCRKLVA